MPATPPEQSTFDVRHEETPGDVLLCGFAEYGLAGLTAADYLVKQLGLEQTGHITAGELPAITPFEDGRPRHHTRIFSSDDADLSVLVGELFIPRQMAKPFSDSVLDWAERSVEELAVLSGVPTAHGPEEHQTYFVATDDYREHRLADHDIPPMGGGFLDGVNAALVQRGLDTALRVGVFATPAHAQTPDVEAALRLLDAAATVYDLDVDVEPLESFASEVQRYYADLAERMQRDDPTPQPDDRMYM
ncbi:proteasome assembly chaperone family protein [Halomarina litorea]|uniref:proteasome assembly chaperone family protein n=1 Tax=Halomarina litorea TaxID=2961595 RepID=UPI0020C579ED|nr:PAC2 family protein [Halomarina sp. BCD28]